MKNIQECLTSLRAIYPKAIEISKKSPQGGLYLIFDGIKTDEWKKDAALFRLIIQSRSFMDERNSILKEIDALREQVFSKGVSLFGVDIFRGIKFDGIDGSLYSYSLNFEIPIHRELIDSSIEEELC